MAQVQALQSGDGVIARTDLGNICFFVGTGTPPGSAVGYEHGCIYLRLDGTGTNDAIYVNENTSASSTFTVLNIN